MLVDTLLVLVKKPTVVFSSFSESTELDESEDTSDSVFEPLELELSQFLGSFCDFDSLLLISSQSATNGYISLAHRFVGPCDVISPRTNPRGRCNGVLDQL